MARRPGSTGSGCSNAGGASVESRVARLERNFKGLAAWASTGDAQRLEEVAAAAKQAQADARRWSERVQQLEARLSLPAPANSAQSVEPLGDDRALALERHLYELDAEVRQLQENLPSRISEDEKVHSGILEEVHRDLLGPVAVQRSEGRGLICFQSASSSSSRLLLLLLLLLLRLLNVVDLKPPCQGEPSQPCGKP
ncbi:unnamed protein product [Effrenium voratum]|nr:unnamed protein product [Effrenium voratum]